MVVELDLEGPEERQSLSSEGLYLTEEDFQNFESADPDEFDELLDDMESSKE